jgi:hypothetical protein
MPLTPASGIEGALPKVRRCPTRCGRPASSLLHSLFCSLTLSSLLRAQSAYRHVHALGAKLVVDAHAAPTTIAPPSSLTSLYVCLATLQGHRDRRLLPWPASSRSCAWATAMVRPSSMATPLRPTPRSTACTTTFVALSLTSGAYSLAPTITGACCCCAAPSSSHGLTWPGQLGSPRAEPSCPTSVWVPRCSLALQPPPVSLLRAANDELQ